MGNFYETHEKLPCDDRLLAQQIINKAIHRGPLPLLRSKNQTQSYQEPHESHPSPVIRSLPRVIIFHRSVQMTLGVCCEAPKWTREEGPQMCGLHAGWLGGLVKCHVEYG